MTEEQLWARLKQIQEDDDYDERIKITVVIKPNRRGTRSVIAVHEGDTRSGRMLLPTIRVEAGNEESTVVGLVKTFGTARVAVEARNADGEWTYETAIVEAA